MSRTLKLGALAIGLAALVPVALASDAFASEDDAEECLRTKIWDGYNDGWAVRTATSATLGKGEYRIYLVTLYAGNEYQIMSCADAEASNIDLVLHDADGNVVAQDGDVSRQPMVTYKPTSTDTYFVAVHATELVNPTGKSGVGMAVTYR
jgi:hypothetical protein